MRTGSFHAAGLRAGILLLIATLFVAGAGIGRSEAASYAGIVVDAKTGKTLYAKNADSPRYPASLTKMMTLYMVFELMEAGKLSRDTRISISRHAASMQPSKLGLKPGQTITVENAILALVTKSANDVAAAVGEHIGGTESRFAEMMTTRARQLGMSKTTFRNASGLPNSSQVTTARDMATLGIALREHFPRHYGYFSKRSFKYGKNTYGNHNRLLGQVRGMDGIKTGYTRASGFNLVSSVEDRNRSIVAVVIGGKSGRSRNAQMTNLISKYLPRASTGRDGIVVARAGKPATARPGTILAGIFKLPTKSVPVPQPSPIVTASLESNDRVAAAHSDALAYAEPDSGNRRADIIRKQLAKLGSKKLPVPEPSPAASADPVVTASIQPVDAVASTSAAAETSVPEGWQIQIGAMPSLESAVERLERARSKTGRTLASVENYTEMVEKNGAVLYRARFAGFASKDAAWNACAALKKQKFDCLALEN